MYIYELQLRVSDVSFLTGSARKPMLLLLISSLYPHYYSWWMLFNYYNDEYFHQYWHQMFFLVTEMASTIAVMSALHKDNLFTPRKLLLIVR